MPTELRAALRDAAAMLDSYSEIGFCSAAELARAKAAEEAVAQEVGAELEAAP